MNGSPEPPVDSLAEDSESGRIIREAQVLQRISSIEFTAYSGPIPHPDLLQRFDEIYPGAAKQILEDFIQESAHRRSIERKVVSTDAFSQIFGSISAGLIGLLGVSGGLWLLHEGRPLGGLSSVFATLASLLSVYLYQNRKAEEERSEQPTQPVLPPAGPRNPESRK